MPEYEFKLNIYTRDKFWNFENSDKYIFCLINGMFDLIEVFKDEPFYTDIKKSLFDLTCQNNLRLNKKHNNLTVTYHRI